MSPVIGSHYAGTNLPVLLLFDYCSQSKYCCSGPQTKQDNACLRFFNPEQNEPCLSHSGHIHGKHGRYGSDCMIQAKAVAFKYI